MKHYMTSGEELENIFNEVAKRKGTNYTLQCIPDKNGVNLSLNEENAEIYCCELFIRALSYIQQHGMKGEVSELFILLTRKDRPSVCCKVCPVTDADYQYAISEEQLKQTRFSFSTDEFRLSEWDMVNSKRDDK